MKSMFSRVGLAAIGALVALFTLLAVTGKWLDRALGVIERAGGQLVWPVANLGMANIVDILAGEGSQSDGVVVLANASVPAADYGVPSQGPVTQPSNPSQAQAAFALGQSAVVVYYSTQDPANVAANSTAEQDFTVTGVAAGSVVHAIKPTTSAGLLVDSARVKAANTVSVTFSNVTAAGIDAASELWIFVEFRGPLIQSAALTPAAVASLTTMEQTFNLVPAAGQQGLASAKVGLTSGVTTLSQNPPAATSLAAGAQPTSINRTPVLKGNPQTVILNKPTAQAGLGIVNTRISDNNQLAITYVNTSGAPITPTAETYTFVAFHGVSLNSAYVIYLAELNPAAVAQGTSAEQTFTVNGLAAADRCIGVQKPTQQAGLVIGGARVSALNTIAITYGNIPNAGGNITPTTEVYSLFIDKSGGGKGAIITQFTAFIVPAAVAAITSAEQTFNVPGIVSAAPVVVNAYGAPSSGSTFATSMGQALPAGLMIGGARGSAADTLAINFGNVTANAITPGPLMLTILQLPADQSGPTAGTDGQGVIYPVSNQDVQQSEQLAAIWNALTARNTIAGA